MNPKPSHSNQGFTLLEMLLVVAIIAVLAGIVVVAINPGKQLATVRNTERSFNLNEIHKAMQQYFIDHYIYPAATPTTLTEICNTGNLPYPSGIDCGTLIDLSPLVPTYLTSIPVDPQGSTLSFINNFIPKVYATTNGTGYKIKKSSDNKIVLTAPQAELGETIAIWPNSCTATGGTITEVNGYCIHTFLSNGTFVSPTGGLSVTSLVVGGGGGGGAYIGGGGGGGGLLELSGTLPAGNYSIVIGPGGAGGSSGAPSAASYGTNGGNTTAFGETAIGGGGGGYHCYGGCGQAGKAGGSGAGAGPRNNGTNAGGAATQGAVVGTYLTGTAYSHAGGISGLGSNYIDYGGGGGGGANAVGGNSGAVTGYAGAGSAGRSNSINGSVLYWAAGGGGAKCSAYTGYGGGTGGIGGGGGGASGGSSSAGLGGGTALNSGSNGQSGSSAVGGAAGANTGSGGGGGVDGIAGGSGGSGIVIVRYPK